MSVTEILDFLSSEDLKTIEIFWTFGRLTNNTDMHLGNLSCTIAGDKFALLPVYDMCAMGYSPSSSGEVPTYKKFTPPVREKLDISDSVYQQASSMATEFWGRLRADQRISEEFGAVLTEDHK